jgi:hypothetical protein
VAPRARLLLSSFSLLAAAHIVRHTVAITAITTATIRATTRAITATGGVATIGLGGVIGITAGIMAGGAGTAGAAEVGGMAAADAAGMAADGAGMVTIDLKSSPATFWGYLAADLLRREPESQTNMSPLPPKYHVLRSLEARR